MEGPLVTESSLLELSARRTIPTESSLLEVSHVLTTESSLLEADGAVFVRPIPKFVGIRIEKLVVESGQATVYVGIHEKSNMRVAVKVMHLHDKNSQAAYREELETLLQLRHPNILRIVTTFEKPQDCIVTRWMDGGPLNEWLQRAKDINGGKPISWVGAGRKIALDVANGLAYLHGEGKVHRDLKSLNVFMGDDGVAVLADFGFAKSVDVKEKALQVATFQIGTLHWMAPEMIRDETFSFASDIYAFGIIVWEILACVIPYANFAKKRQLEDAVLAGVRPPIEPSWPHEAKDLMIRSWCADSSARLTAATISKLLSESIQQMPEIIPKRMSSSSPAENPEDLFRAAQKLVKSKVLVDATVLLRKALAQKMDEARFLALLADCLQQAGDFVGALVLAEKVQRLNPSDKSSAKMAKDIQKYLSSQKWYRVEGASLVSADDAVNARKLASERMGASEFGSALRFLHFALLFEPTNTNMLQAVGVCLQKLAKFNETIYAFKVLVAFVNDSKERKRVYHSIAAIYEYIKAPDKAKAIRELADMA
jgi:serine/threonine protein kinase